MYDSTFHRILWFMKWGLWKITVDMAHTLGFEVANKRDELIRKEGLQKWKTIE